MTIDEAKEALRQERNGLHVHANLDEALDIALWLMEREAALHESLDRLRMGSYYAFKPFDDWEREHPRPGSEGA